MLLIAPHDLAMQQRLADDLAQIESRFAAELLSDLACVNQLVSHIESYRGKMLRPTLVLVSAMASDPKAPSSTDAQRVVATVVEMVHMATLVHDDILDDADMRRGGTTINALAGNETAVMLGDFLISHAYHLCSSIGRADISRLIAEATNVVCEGELLQLANRNNWRLDERTYFEIIRRKTACLCGMCCKVGAVLGHCDDAIAEALYAYGEKLGVAFQIVDDVLDLTGDEQTVGKTLGLDLEKGKLTLPLIHGLKTADEPQRRQLHDLLDAHGCPETIEADRMIGIGRIRDHLTESGSMDYAREWASRLIRDGKQRLADHLDDSPARTMMMDMADAVLTRDF